MKRFTSHFKFKKKELSMDKTDETAEQEDLKQALERSRLYIVEMLAAEGPILDRLRSKGVLSEEDSDLIKNKNLNRTRREQAGCFLDIICKKGSNGMLSFIEGLEYTNRELYKKITGKEPKEQQCQRFNRESDPKFLEYVNHLTTKFIVLTKQLRDVRDDRDSVLQEKKTLQEENKQLVKEKEDMKNRMVTCERIMRKNLRAHAELSKLQEEHIIIQKNLQEYMKENSDYQKKCHMLQIRKDKLEQQFQQTQLENDKLRDKLKDIRDNFNREQNLSKQLRKQIAKVPSMEEYESLIKEKNILAREMRILRTCSISLSECKTVNGHNDLKVRIEALEDQISQLQKECELLANELYQTRRTLDEVEQEKDMYMNLQQKLTVDQTILEENCNVYKERRDVLLKQLQQSKEERDDAIKERNKAQQEVEEKTIDRDQLIYEKQELDDERLQYKQQVHLLNDKLNQLMKKIERLTGENSSAMTPVVCHNQDKIEFIALNKESEITSKATPESTEDEDSSGLERLRHRTYNLKYYNDKWGMRSPFYFEMCSKGEILRKNPVAIRSSSLSAQTYISIKRSEDVDETKRISDLSFSWENLNVIDENPDLIRYLPMGRLDDDSPSVIDESSINLRYETQTCDLSLTVHTVSHMEVIGGNVTGIFCKTTINGENLEEGDQLMSMKYTSDKEKEINFVECTLQYARQALKEASEKSSTTIHIIVSKCHKAYENLQSWLQMGRTSGDQFFIRSRIAVESKEAGCLNISVGDVFQIIDTVHDSHHWYAKSVNTNDSKETIQGSIPNYQEAIVILKRMSLKIRRATTFLNIPTSKVTSLMFQDQCQGGLKRKPVIRTKMWNIKPGFRELDLKNLSSCQEKLPDQPYVTVKPMQCPPSRPVLIYGPQELVQSLREQLVLLDSSPLFEECHMSDITPSSEKSDELNRVSQDKDDIDLEEIYHIVKQGKHCLLDIPPSAIESSELKQLFPIIFLLRSTSQRSRSLPSDNLTQQFRCASEAEMREQCPEVEEVENLLESYMYEDINLLPNKDMKSVALQIQQQVKDKRSQFIWIECDNSYTM